MMMTRRIALLLVSLFAAASLFAACGGNEAEAPANGTAPEQENPPIQT
jgi:hypothetical protein